MMYDFELTLVDVIKTFFKDLPEAEIKRKVDYFFENNHDYKLVFKVDKKLRDSCIVEESISKNDYILLKTKDILNRGDAVVVPKMYSSTQQDAVFVVCDKIGVYVRLRPTQLSVTLLREIPKGMFIEVMKSVK
jgi:hypothetical protein